MEDILYGDNGATIETNKAIIILEQNGNIYGIKSSEENNILRSMLRNSNFNLRLTLLKLPSGCLNWRQLNVSARSDKMKTLTIKKITL